MRSTPTRPRNLLRMGGIGGWEGGGGGSFLLCLFQEGVTQRWRSSGLSSGLWELPWKG